MQKNTLTVLQSQLKYYRDIGDDKNVMGICKSVFNVNLLTNFHAKMALGSVNMVDALIYFIDTVEDTYDISHPINNLISHPTGSVINED